MYQTKLLFLLLILVEIHGQSRCSTQFGIQPQSRYPEEQDFSPCNKISSPSDCSAQSADPIQVEFHDLSRYLAKLEIDPQSRCPSEYDISPLPKISSPSDNTDRSIEPYKVENPPKVKNEESTIVHFGAFSQVFVY